MAPVRLHHSPQLRRVRVLGHGPGGGAAPPCGMQPGLSVHHGALPVIAHGFGADPTTVPVVWRKPGIRPCQIPFPNVGAERDPT